MSDILTKSEIIKKKEKRREYYLQEKERKKLLNANLKMQTLTLKSSEIDLAHRLMETGIEAVKQFFEEDKVTKTDATLILMRYEKLLNKFNRID